MYGLLVVAMTVNNSNDWCGVVWCGYVQSSGGASGSSGSAVVAQALHITSSVLSMSQDELSVSTVSSVVSVVNAVCSGLALGGSSSGVSQSVLSIVSRLNVANAELAAGSSIRTGTCFGGCTLSHADRHWVSGCRCCLFVCVVGCVLVCFCLWAASRWGAWSGRHQR